MNWMIVRERTSYNSHTLMHLHCCNFLFIIIIKNKKNNQNMMVEDGNNNMIALFNNIITQ